MANQVRLTWQKFGKWSEAADTKETTHQFPCVYVVADKELKPLYIGSTVRDGRGDSRWFGGLTGRYFSDVGALDASMDGSGNSIFIAEVKPAEAGDIETKLIYENQPKYNKRGRTKAPQSKLTILHEGDTPKIFIVS